VAIAAATTADNNRERLTKADFGMGMPPAAEGMSVNAAAEFTAIATAARREFHLRAK
jgi:hypothetical protein